MDLFIKAFDVKLFPFGEVLVIEIDQCKEHFGFFGANSLTFMMNIYG